MNAGGQNKNRKRPVPGHKASSPDSFSVLRLGVGVKSNDCYNSAPSQVKTLSIKIKPVSERVLWTPAFLLSHQTFMFDTLP